MERRPLGTSGLDVSVVGLGAWAMGGDPADWGQVDDRESIEAIHQALDCGINLIDTAPIYGRGHSEQLVGQALHGRREGVVVATKCGALPSTSSGAAPIRCLAPDSIERECEASRRRLRVDVIDLYQCHWPDPATPIRATMETLAALRDQGKIRAVGLCNFSCEQVALAREYGPVHALQAPLSFVQRRTADDLLPYCREQSTAVLACSPLAKGLLTGKFSAEARPTGLRGRDPEFVGARLRRHLALLDTLRPIAEECGKSLTQLAIQWVATTPGVTAAVVGAKRPSHVIENAASVGWSLSDETRRRIERALTDHEREA